MTIDDRTGRIKQLNGIARLIQNIGGPGEDQILARGNLCGGSNRQSWPADRVIVDLPATNRYRKRAGVIEFSPFAAAQRVGHKLIDHHSGTLRTGDDMIGQDDPDECQDRDPEE